MSSGNDIPFQVKRYVINKFISLPKFLGKLGYDVRESGSMFCPFHDDEGGGHPSAKLYHDDTGYRVFCFVERKQFGSWDAIRLLTKEKPDNYFEKIWSRLTPEQQETIINNSGEAIQVLPEKWPEVKTQLQMFKTTQVDYNGYLDIWLANLDKVAPAKEFKKLL